MQVSFSTLILSVGSSAVVAMGLEKNPLTQKFEKDLDVAKLNIDTLLMLKEKTKNNLNEEEKQFLDHMISDLQMRYVQAQAAQKKE